MRFIAFGHRRQMGKDTAVRQLKKWTTSRSIITECKAFADPLYSVCRLLYGWDGFESKEYYDEHPEDKMVSLPNIGMSPRDLLIRMGTPAVRQNVWEPTWIEYLMHVYPKDSERLVLISDLRFPNEMDAVHANEGICIRVIRPGIEESSDVADIALSGSNDFDIDLFNDGDIESLGRNAWFAVNNWVKDRGYRTLYEWVIRKK